MWGGTVQSDEPKQEALPIAGGRIREKRFSSRYADVLRYRSTCEY